MMYNENCHFLILRHLAFTGGFTGILNGLVQLDDMSPFKSKNYKRILNII